MATGDFVYTLYIATEQEQLWRALVDPAFTSRYFFGTRFESDWRPGSDLYVRPDQGERILWGKVLRFEAPRLLSYTFDGPAHGGQIGRATVATFELQAHGGGVRLTLVHGKLQPQDLDARRDTFHGLNNGWPAILSSLKSLLETGEPYRFLPMDSNGEYS